MVMSPRCLGVQVQRKTLLPVLSLFEAAGLRRVCLAAFAFAAVAAGVGAGRVPEGIRGDPLGHLELDPGLRGFAGSGKISRCSFRILFRERPGSMAATLSSALKSPARKERSRAMGFRTGCLSDSLTRPQAVMPVLSLDVPGYKPVVQSAESYPVVFASLLRKRVTAALKMPARPQALHVGADTDRVHFKAVGICTGVLRKAQDGVAGRLFARPRPENLALKRWQALRERQAFLSAELSMLRGRWTMASNATLSRAFSAGSSISRMTTRPGTVLRFLEGAP
jgi:hypothetical protein